MAKEIIVNVLGDTRREQWHTVVNCIKPFLSAQSSYGLLDELHRYIDSVEDVLEKRQRTIDSLIENPYAYTALYELCKATSDDTVTNALGEWMERFGNDYWNGQCYILDKDHDLYPIYKDPENDDFDIIGYEVR